MYAANGSYSEKDRHGGGVGGGEVKPQRNRPGKIRFFFGFVLPCIGTHRIRKRVHCERVYT